MNGLDFLTLQRWIGEIKENQVNTVKAYRNFHIDDFNQMEELTQVVIAQNKLLDEQTKLLQSILDELKKK